MADSSTIIFWTFVDISNIEFAIANKFLQEISKDYKCYFICSGNIGEIIKKYYCDPQIIESENNIQLKGELFYNRIKKEKFDVLIKVDVDALILDKGRLFNAVKNLEREAMGVVHSSVYGNYIRGGCNAVDQKAVKDINIKESSYFNKNEFDFIFALAIKKAKIKIIDYPLFEVSENWTGNVPVWHPPKVKLDKRLLIFKEQLNKNGK